MFGNSSLIHPTLKSQGTTPFRIESNPRKSEYKNAIPPSVGIQFDSIHPSVNTFSTFVVKKFRGYGTLQDHHRFVPFHKCCRRLSLNSTTEYHWTKQICQVAGKLLSSSKKLPYQDRLKNDQREVETYLHLFTTETNPKALAIFITRFHLKMEDLMQQITDRRGNPEFLKKFKETSKEIQTLANATLLTK